MGGTYVFFEKTKRTQGLPKKFSQDPVLLYAEARGISPDAARKRRARGSVDWQKWEAENAPKKKPRKSAPRKSAPPAAADKSLSRYRDLEDKTHAQLLGVQEKLDDALEAHNPTEIRICSQSLKDVASLYNEAVQLRKQAEILASQLIPAEVLDKYKSDFYPRLEKGVEEMRMHIEATLPDHMRADFKFAWRAAYHKYQTAAIEAESAIESVRSEAKKTKLK